MAGAIFINYRRDDSTSFAGRLHDRLSQDFGRENIFMDVDHIPAGVDFVVHLNNQVAACKVLLVVIGSKWLRAKDASGHRRLDQPSDFVAVEIAAALSRDILVIPVLTDGARMPKESELPDALKSLARRQAIDVRQEHFGRDAEALVERIRVALDGPAAPRRRQGMMLAAGAAALLLIAGAVGFALVQRAEPKQPEPEKPPHLIISGPREPWIGAQLAKVPDGIAAGSEKNRGALVESVDDKGPAVNTGIAPNDVILGYDDHEVKDADDLRRLVAKTHLFRMVQVVFVREGKEYTKPLRVDRRPGSRLGVRIRKVTPEIARKVGLGNPHGLLVDELDDPGPASTAGIAPGDVILGCNGEATNDIDELTRALGKTPAGETAQVSLFHGQHEFQKSVVVGH